MSLLDKASLVVTPNAVKAGKLYSVIPNTTFGDMTVVRATTATRVNSLGLIESVSVNVPRVDYTNGSCPSLLVEPQRTNLATNSDGNVSTYGTAVNVTNASSSFNSFTNAIQFPNTGLALAYKSIATTAQTYAISVFIKMDDNSVPILSASSTTGNVSLIIGGNIATNNLKVESYGNNVYRLSATATSLGLNNNNGVLRYDTQVLKSFKITGIQLEAASYPTSYIPTVASTVTRNADVISKTGISSLIGQTEGTVFIDFNYNINLGNQDSYLIYIGQSDNSGVNSIYIDYVNGFFRWVVNSGSLTFFYQTSAIIGRNKLALSYKSGKYGAYRNGAIVSLSTNTNMPPLCSKIGINIAKFAIPVLNNVNSAQLYKTQLTDAECVALTTL
jgi:hypothetical protein